MFFLKSNYLLNYITEICQLDSSFKNSIYIEYDAAYASFNFLILFSKFFICWHCA